MSMIFVGRRLTSMQVRDLETNPSMTVELLDEEDAPLELDLDKAWHGIHFLLTGNAWETTPGAGQAVLGGDPIGEDNGYGPARLLQADIVSQVAAGLQNLDVASLRARFDPAAFKRAEIYPEIWDEEEVFDTYLMPNFLELRAFYLTAAEENQATLLAIT